LARKVKYLILTGDNIEGVGVYPGQERFLSIKSCRNQYRKLEEILRKIRSDVQIVMCPGQHDAVWLGEPQPAISEKWLQGLYNMKNLHLVSNPGLVEISGFKILMYYGLSIGKIKDFIINGKSLKTNEVVKEILKRRHLAPSYGFMDVVVDRDVDRMVVDVVPDIIVVGNGHRAEVDNYNNVLMVAGSCWQSITSFEENVGSVPDPCKVPLFNLKSREIKIIDFSDDEVKWEEGEDLVCKLGVKNENCN
jgi:DNA polymerase II small subunit